MREDVWGAVRLPPDAEDLSDAGKAKIETVRENFSELSDAYALKEHLRAIYDFAQSQYGAHLILEDWCEVANATNVLPER